MTINRQWILKSRPQGFLNTSNFETQESALKPLQAGQARLKVCYLSFDPTQRIWASIDSYVPKVALGEVMRALGVGQVIESKTAKYKVGDLYITDVGWQQYKTLDTNHREIIKPQKIPGFLDPVLTLALSLTAVTAMLGISKIGRVGKGDQVLISGAAGAVGSIACQIAKAKGARVIGIAGGPDKCQHLLEDLGIDGAIDYKNSDVIQEIDSQLSSGIDLYFDNVGGEILDHVLTRLNKKARIILCGAISEYDKISQENIDAGVTSSTKNIFNLVVQSASMHGFVITDYEKQIPNILLSLFAMLKNNQLICDIDMQHGFENIPSCLNRLFSGKNQGKQLLTLSEPPLPVDTDKIRELLFNSLIRVKRLLLQ